MKKIFVANISRYDIEHYLVKTDFDSQKELEDYLIESIQFHTTTPLMEIYNIFYYDVKTDNWEFLDELNNFKNSIRYFLLNYNLKEQEVLFLDFIELNSNKEVTYEKCLLKEKKYIKLLLPEDNDDKFFKDYKEFVSKYKNYDNYIKLKKDFDSKSDIFEFNKILEFSYKECEKNEFLQYIRKNDIVEKDGYVYIRLYESNISKYFTLMVKTKNGETIDVPQQYAGYIIGRNGENLRRLKELLKKKRIFVRFNFPSKEKGGTEEVPVSYYRSFDLVKEEDGKYYYVYIGKYGPGIYFVCDEKIEYLEKSKYNLGEEILKEKNINISANKIDYVLSGKFYFKNGNYYFQLDLNGPHLFIAASWGGSFSETGGYMYNTNEKILFKKVARSNNGKLGVSYFVIYK